MMGQIFAKSLSRPKKYVRKCSKSKLIQFTVKLTSANCVLYGKLLQKTGILKSHVVFFTTALLKGDV